MITANDRDPLRVINSEVKGWDFDQVHAGTWDQREIAAWTGRPWQQFIMQGWVEGAAFRKARNEKMKAFDGLVQKVSELSQNPTKEELAGVVTQLKERAEEVKRLEDKVKQLETEKTEDSKTLDQAAEASRTLWDIIKSVFNRSKK